MFAELEWSARHQIDIASIADANFGIIERDVEIAEKIAELKRKYGYPRTVATNYAKNTVKHLRKIVEIFADVEILTEGVVSLQSMDEPTLKIIRRSNIKLEKYDELADRVPTRAAASLRRHHDGTSRGRRRPRSATTCSSAPIATSGARATPRSSCPTAR